MTDEKKKKNNDPPYPSSVYVNYDKLEPLTWSPDVFSAFKVLISARLCAAVWSNISDCDETYNYWEPTHYVIYGRGMQTWEYSPLFAIRSYAYLWLYALPGFIFDTLLQNQRMFVFFFIRCAIGFAEASCEVIFYKAIGKKFGPHIAKLYLIISLFCTGMFISSAAFLPSSFSMKLLMLSYAAWWLNQDFLAIFWTVLNVFLGWPFSGALGIPIAIDLVIVKKRFRTSIQYGMLSVMIVLPFVLAIDSFYFGRHVIAAINIVAYNVFSKHGPNLYGTEPFSFYLKNGLLNFNYAFILALISLPLLLLTQYKKIPVERIQIIPMTGMYLWFLIFFTQPHKEERFLFPAYPLVLLNAVISLDLMQRWLHRLLFKTKYKHHLELNEKWWLLPIMISCFIGLSRSMLLYKGYHAPMTTAMELVRIANPDGLNKPPLPSHQVNLCVGKEWYRFPGSFFLPDRWELHFIKSEFRGQLPKPFGSGKYATREIPTEMNDGNREETSRYLSLSKCHFLIDSESVSVTSREPNFTKHPDFKIIHTSSFMDASRSPFYTRLIYLPLVWETKAMFVNYNILENLKRPVKLDARRS